MLKINEEDNKIVSKPNGIFFYENFNLRVLYKYWIFYLLSSLSTSNEKFLL